MGNKHCNNFTKISQENFDEIEKVLFEEPVVDEVAEDIVDEAVEVTPASNSFEPYNVKVGIPNLNIRKGPGFNYDTTGRFTGIGVFMIVEACNGKGSDSGWGRLSSGEGWISLDHTERV